MILVVEVFILLLKIRTSVHPLQRKKILDLRKAIFCDWKKWTKHILPLIVGVDGDLPWYKDIKVYKQSPKKIQDYIETFDHMFVKIVENPPL